MISMLYPVVSYFRFHMSTVTLNLGGVRETTSTLIVIVVDHTHISSNGLECKKHETWYLSNHEFQITTRRWLRAIWNWHTEAVIFCTCTSVNCRCYTIWNYCIFVSAPHDLIVFAKINYRLVILTFIVSNEQCNSGQASYLVILATQHVLVKFVGWISGTETSNLMFLCS